MELPHIGTNCDAVACRQLDFLPFVCDGCKKMFCLQHRTKEAHSCTAPSDVQKPEFKGEKSYACSISGCAKRELTQIICPHCQINFCLNHRVQEDHSCVKLPEKRPEVSKTTEHVQEILAQREVKGKPARKLTNPKSIQLAAKVNLMKMKGKAVGDVGVPQSERVYFNIIFPHSSGKLPTASFFSKVWTVGRIIDIIAERASIVNVNNTAADKKLRLFHADTGRLLPMDRAVGVIMDDPNSLLHNGSSLILEHVVDTLDVLGDIELYQR